MRTIFIKKKGIDEIVVFFYVIFVIVFLFGVFHLECEEIKEIYQEAKEAKVYCQDFFDENKENGYFNKKELEVFKLNLKNEYGFESNLNANFIEDKEDMFLSVEIYKTNVNGNKLFYKEYFFDKNSFK